MASVSVTTSDHPAMSCDFLYSILKFLLYFPDPVSSLCSLHPQLLLILIEVLINFLQLCLFCFLIFLSISTQSYMLTPVLSTCTLGTNSHSVTLDLSLHNQGEERHWVEMRKREWGWLCCSCCAPSEQGLSSHVKPTCFIPTAVTSSTQVSQGFASSCLTFRWWKAGNKFTL